MSTPSPSPGFQDRLVDAGSTPGSFVREALAICREHRDTIIGELTSPDADQAKEMHELVRNRVRHQFDSLAGAWPDRDGLADVIEFAFNEAQQLLDPALVVRAVLWAVEVPFLPSLMTEMAARGRFELQHDDWFIKPEPELRECFEERHGTVPHLGPHTAYGQLWHLLPASTARIASFTPNPVVGVAMVDASHSARLAEALRGLPKMAAINPSPPNLDRREVAFGYGPEDSRPVRETALEKLQAAAAEDVTVAVMPELC